MNKSENKPVIGIIGGIASGKSTVAAEFGKLGCKVIDADKIAHEILDKNEIQERIVQLFGKEILDIEGKIDRRKLGKIVFSDVKKINLLTELIHPPILVRIEELIEKYNNQKDIPAIVLDVPLLVEVGWGKRCTRLIFVECPQKKRAQRLKKMGFEEKELKIRENFQISLDIKANLADNIIEYNSGFSALVRQVADIFSDIMGNE